LAQLLKTQFEDGSYWIAIAYALRKENDLAFGGREGLRIAGTQFEHRGSDYFASVHGTRWQQFFANEPTD